MKTTRYFDEDVRGRREEALREDWILMVLGAPDSSQVQEDGRIRAWGYIEEAGKWLRVVTLPVRETVHNVFFDRGYRKGERKRRVQ